MENMPGTKSSEAPTEEATASADFLAELEALRAFLRRQNKRADKYQAFNMIMLALFSGLILYNEFLWYQSVPYGRPLILDMGQLFKDKQTLVNYAVCLAAIFVFLQALRTLTRIVIDSVKESRRIRKEAKEM